MTNQSDTHEQELLPCPFEGDHRIQETTLPRMVRCFLHTAWLSPEQWNAQSLHARVLELERRLKIPFGKLPCAQCGGPHDFDTSVDSEIWNRVIRAKELPEYLCTTCIVREFAKAGESFSAKLWGEEFKGTPITVAINTRLNPSLEDERMKAIARVYQRFLQDFIDAGGEMPDDVPRARALLLPVQPAASTEAQNKQSAQEAGDDV